MNSICCRLWEPMGVMRPAAHFFARSQRFFIVIGILVIKIGETSMSRNMMKCVIFGGDVVICIVGIILGLRLWLIGKIVLISWLLSIGIALQEFVQPGGDSHFIWLIFCYWFLSLFYHRLLQSFVWGFGILYWCSLQIHLIEYFRKYKK